MIDETKKTPPWCRLVVGYPSIHPSIQGTFCPSGAMQCWGRGYSIHPEQVAIYHEATTRQMSIRSEMLTPAANSELPVGPKCTSVGGINPG